MKSADRIDTGFDQNVGEHLDRFEFSAEQRRSLCAWERRREFIKTEIEFHRQFDPVCPSFFPGRRDRLADFGLKLVRRERRGR